MNVRTKEELCLVFGLVCLLLGQGASLAASQKYQKFAVYYSDKERSAAFDSFDLLVLDSDYHPDLTTLADRGKTLLGYLSLGEVEKIRSYYGDVRKEGILLQENPYWEGSYFVDLRDERWTSRVIEKLIPRILAQGFHGLFLDTLDNPGHLERTDPRKFKGMISAAEDLVKTIRYHYPTTKIMLNRAYEILPQVSSDIDMVLGESVFADYDFEKKVCQRVEEKLYLQQVEMLKSAQSRSPGLQVMTLDYWDPDDHEGILEIYTEQRQNGFVPYVATIDLDILVPEPKR